MMGSNCVRFLVRGMVESLARSNKDCLSLFRCCSSLEFAPVVIDGDEKGKESNKP